VRALREPKRTVLLSCCDEPPNGLELSGGYFSQVPIQKNVYNILQSYQAMPDTVRSSEWLGRLSSGERLCVDRSGALHSPPGIDACLKTLPLTLVMAPSHSSWTQLRSGLLGPHLVALLADDPFGQCFATFIIQPVQRNL
jgi:hypothetical protein